MWSVCVWGGAVSCSGHGHTPSFSLTVRHQVVTALTAMRTVRTHGLLKWVAQPDAEAGKGMGTVLSPTSHDA